MDVQQSPSSSDTTVSTDGNTPAASPGGEQKPQGTVLDHVLKAMGRDKEPAAGESPAQASAEGQEPPANAPGATDEVEPGAEADAKLPFAQHPRFKQVLRQRAAFKAQVEERDQRLADLEPKAKNYDGIVNFARSAGMTQEYVGDLFHMGKLMLEDPIGFHEAFKDQWAQIELKAGVRLPPDLQQQVQAGKLTPEAAKEIARHRATAEQSTTALQRHTQRTEQERREAEEARQREEIERQSQAIGNSVSGWERQWKGSDPDYAIKQPYVRDRIENRMLKERPQTTEAVLKLCNEVKEQVTKELRAHLSRQRTTINTPPSSGTSVETQGQPRNVLDAVKQGLHRLAG